MLGLLVLIRMFSHKKRQILDSHLKRRKLKVSLSLKKSKFKLKCDIWLSNAFVFVYTIIYFFKKTFESQILRFSF
jgi:hypothetical protein